ncbi:DUF6361 family protein [Burkholderia pyrrocinia]|uniref:DUF6361 family protein n=1 Tax=Burkholderia pyrrocinia TaxID=60550 RepID=UPI00215B30CC|nr:DUF6361 family protein [Burkholderia pyrrocinia]UVE66927.1 DUF6361 family protein [Burkholderia pyrrocinia]
MSSVGWIDFSSTDRERVTGVLALLSETGTLDELGIGQLRDAFADSLFPGFSTVQTRAKYFVTVPQIFDDYWAMTPRERGRRSLESYLKESEDYVAERLVRNHEADQRELGEPFPTGIIGKERVGKGGASRRPSSAYWTGLRKFGLVDTELSIAEFSRSTSEQQPVGRLLRDGTEIDSEDDDDVVKRRRLVATIPRRSSNWHEDIRIGLTRPEAELLYNKIRYVEALKHSIPAQLINAGLFHDGTLLGAGNFEALSGALEALPQVSEICRTTARNAARFSKAFLGAHLRFNYLIAEKLEQARRVDELGEEFAAWRVDAKEHDLFNAATIDEWLSPSVALQVGLNANTRRFIRRWHEAMSDYDTPTERLDVLVREQADANKGNRSLLKRSLSSDMGWAGIHTLQYRWPQAKQILTDIREGLAC